MAGYTEAISPNVATDSVWTPEVWDLEIRSAALPLYTFRQFARSVRSEWGDSDTVSVVKRNDINTAGGVLTAGSTIPRHSFTTSTVTYTPQEYGNAISPEARVLRLSPFAMQNQIKDVLARDAASVLDNAVRTVLMSGITAGENAFCVGAGGTVIGTTVPSGTVGTSTYRLTAHGVWSAVDYLTVQNAPKIYRSGVGEGYVGILHPYQARGIKRDSNFINANLYTSDNRVYNNEIGYWEGVYWIETTQGYRDPANNNYCAIVMAADAFGEYLVQEVTYKRDPDTDFGRQQHHAWYADLGWAIEWPNYIAGIFSLSGTP